MRAMTARRTGLRRVVGLCYHSVHPSERFATVTPGVFEKHLSWLVQTCDVIPFREMLEAAGSVDGMRPTVSLTFDDGYADNHDFAFPLLQKYGIPATIFLTAGLIDGDPDVHARFRELRGTEVHALGWSQVRELVEAGVEIGAHTYSHPNLIRLAPREAADELRKSKEVIEDRLGAQVDLLAYPFGKPKRHFDRETADLARNAGYKYAAAVLFRSVRATDSPLAIPRFFTARDSAEELAAKVRGDWDYLGFLQEHLPMPIARVLSPQDFRW